MPSIGCVRPGCSPSCRPATPFGSEKRKRVIAGGTESMSNAPYFLRQARWGHRLGHGAVEDGLLAILNDPFKKYHMGVTAENVAEKWGISRERQDEVAYESQQRMARAMEAGYFDEQIVPVTVKVGREEKQFAVDEHPRPDTTLARLAQMKPAFKDGGTVTAGNASGINDGAAAVLVTSATRAQELGLKPRLVLRAAAAAGVEPEYMGIGPVPAVRKALDKAGLSLDDIDVIELNEAFAAQAEAVVRDLEHGLGPGQRQRRRDCPRTSGRRDGRDFDGEAHV